MEESSIEGVHYRRSTSAIEALRIGLDIIRQAVGDDVILDKDGSPMLVPVGIVDAGRISVDTEHSFQSTFNAATGVAARFYMNRNFFIADPDAFCISSYLNHSQYSRESELKKPYTYEEAKAAIVLSAMAGGMFEDGDDLPSLGTEPNRLALLTNPELLKLMRLSRSATPIDLMTYSKEDIQPSLFWVRESNRQGLLAVFNWTLSTRYHRVSLDQLGLNGKDWEAHEVFQSGGVALHNRSLTVSQPFHSVRLIRLLRKNLPAVAPEVSIQAKGDQQVGSLVSFQMLSKPNGNPLLTYSWNFGDGTTATGEQSVHTFTHDGIFRLQLQAESLDGPRATATRTIKIEGEVKAR